MRKDITISLKKFLWTDEGKGQRKEINLEKDEGREQEQVEGQNIYDRMKQKAQAKDKNKDKGKGKARRKGFKDDRGRGY